MSFVYKGLKANFEKLTVTEHELDRQMDRLRQQTPRVIPVTERAAKMGDDVVLDYAGFVDGKQFDGGTAKEQVLTLGSGMFISAFVGVVTGVGGGVMRDIMSGDIPFVFRKYFYCSASIIGAVVTAALWDTIGAVPAMLLGAAVIVLLRFLAARFRWRLPRAVTDGDIDAGDLTVCRASADGREDGSADDKRG